MLEECGQRHSTAKFLHFLGYSRIFLRKMPGSHFLRALLRLPLSDDGDDRKFCVLKIATTKEASGLLKTGF